ncbi:penicillin-binding transpeptidase domain-containing protein [Paenibacillus sp. P96]|uniref:Penicillin-binding transpeptidase domain-containing protein n=1 Tax=Paenibacillus zeirhizosphaerae TaxID=2987519 RepID=A0ABT9FQY6_9BACL|nr:penicillin-binding transpeptidase domain-containing protein [Paenibacillus sp. P96]MDP4096941.1 penicillin-binding transpeptidase domain-containing protein [Paenibacillus sp. P96]
MVKKIKLRTLLIGGCITLFFLILLFKVFWIQVVRGAELQEQVTGLIQKSQVLPAARGTILDRNGNVLAEDAPAYTVVVNPKIIQEYKLEDVVVSRLHELLGKSEADLRLDTQSKQDSGENAGKYRAYREIRPEGWKIEPELADKIEAFDEELKEKYQVTDAVFTIKETKRFYPENTMAAHVLGYVSKEGKAVQGLEAYYDSQLKGEDGQLLYQRDRKGVSLPNGEQSYKPAKNGKNIKLTIDDTIQYYIEEAMKKAYLQYNPVSMTVIAADPKTMDILGMASMPNFNPNTYNEETDKKSFINNAIQSIYEPGSTFKIVTLAGAVEEGLFNPNAEFDSEPVRIGGFTIKDNGHAYGTISYLEGVKRSSNIAFVNLGYRMLGGEKLRYYIDKFGFGTKTGIDLPAEVPSPIRELTYASEIATAAYGHGLVQVTPIQQIAAISAIANGGKLMEPHLVKEIIDTDTGETQVISPKEVRQVISAKSAQEVGGYLEQVVADQEIGTGRYAYIDGYRVAGKTGTARKVINGEYANDKDIVSFIGYAPVNDPKIALLVVIDEPRVANAGGGSVAGPVFKDIVSQSLRYMGVPKSGDAADNSKKNAFASKMTTAPNLIGKSKKDAQNALLERGTAYVTLGKGSKIVSTYPAANSPMMSGQRMYLITEDSATMNIPDLRGLSLRDSMELLTLLKVGIQIEGEGYVYSQKIQKQGDKRVAYLQLQPAKETVTGVVPESDDEAAEDAASSGDQKGGSEQEETTEEGSSQNGEKVREPAPPEEAPTN